MKFTLSWLKLFLKTSTNTDTIASTLTSLGLEVESITDYQSTLQSFVVAEIIDAIQHPNADKLKVCRVNTSHEKDLQIVCGATNARAGIKVVLAQPGTWVTGLGVVIKKSEIRGVTSNGMLCSSDELGLSGHSDGIIELPTNTNLSDSVAQALGIADPTFDIAITPNRGDCLGVYNIARDLSAAGIGTLIAADVPIPKITATNKKLVAINNTIPELCPQFMASIVYNITQSETEKSWQDKMQLSGLKTISGVIDISNIISHSYNRPLHFFDADKIRGGLTIKLSEGGEQFIGLDNAEYTLPAGLIIICDDVGVISLAGVLGGLSTACDANTKNVLIESAWFQPSFIAKAGQALGIISDARSRFERGVDPKTTLMGIHLAINAINDLCGGNNGEIGIFGDDKYLPQSPKISFNSDIVTKVSGVVINENRVLQILQNIGCHISGDIVTPPSWRSDLNIAEDLVEEVLRIINFDNIKSTQLPPFPPVLQQPNFYHDYLRVNGYNQTLSWSFTSSEWLEKLGYNQKLITIKNPISDQLNVLRPSIIPSLLKTADYNNRHNTKLTKIYEYGPVYADNQQFNCLSLLNMTPAEKTWIGSNHGANPFAVKGLVADIISQYGYNIESLTWLSSDLPSVYHPYQSAGVGMGGNNPVAFFGMLHPDVAELIGYDGNIAIAEIFLDNLPVKKSKNTPYQPQLYPAVIRDLAFLLPIDVTFATVKKAINTAGKPFVTDVNIFDLYQGKHTPDGQKSMALRITLQDKNRTLDDKIINDTINSIINKVVSGLGGILRDGK